MVVSYYDRKTTTHLDGTPVFKTQEDEATQQEVADLVSKTLNCNLRSFGALSPIDWYCNRGGRIIGVLEFKARTHATTTYPTVFLNIRKWLALLLAATGMGVPAYYMVKFTDKLLWINIADVDASKVKLGGCQRVVKSRNDREPVIEIPIEAMLEFDRESTNLLTGT
jgi:hypothetical protein